MRLTAELIERSRAFYNPLYERELDLRAAKIPLIENLGVTKDSFDVIDLSDNELRKLGNFPMMRRLETLLLHNNQIARIDSDIGEHLPALETLMLTNNYVSHFSDIDALATLPKLRMLSLIDNPVFRKRHYRLYAIHKLPSLAVLDFRKIRRQERETAAKLFATEEGQNVVEEAEENKGGTAVLQDAVTGKRATPEQLEAIKAAIANASSAAEIERLEQQLASGIVPDTV